MDSATLGSWRVAVGTLATDLADVQHLHRAAGEAQIDAACVVADQFDLGLRNDDADGGDIVIQHVADQFAAADEFPSRSLGILTRKRPDTGAVMSRARRRVADSSSSEWK